MASKKKNKKSERGTLTARQTRFMKLGILFSALMIVLVLLAVRLVKIVSDHGEYEGALRINLHDQWFPVFEMGIGRANHKDDEVTHLSYKTTAPYFRVGMDWNVMKNKHLPNRIFAGFRYAFTVFNADITHKTQPDPIYQSTSGFSVEGMHCSQHWLELVFGIDAQIYGPMHLGWNIRYLRRLAHKEGELGHAWYVPGFGINDPDNFNANFNIIIDI